MAKVPDSGLFADELPKLEIGSRYRGGIVVEEHKRFYVIDFGKYRECVGRVDLAKEGEVGGCEFMQKLIDKRCVLDETTLLEMANYIKLMQADSYKREGGAIKQKRWGK